VPWFTANTLNILPVVSYGPASQLRRPMMFGKSHLQLMAARVVLFYGKTYSIEITRTICDPITTVRPLNQASSENRHRGAIRHDGLQCPSDLTRLSRFCGLT
jgi:hypothetical protein